MGLYRFWGIVWHSDCADSCVGSYQQLQLWLPRSVVPGPRWPCCSWCGWQRALLALLESGCVERTLKGPSRRAWAEQDLPGGCLHVPVFVQSRVQAVAQWGPVIQLPGALGARSTIHGGAGLGGPGQGQHQGLQHRGLSGPHPVRQSAVLFSPVTSSLLTPASPGVISLWPGGRVLHLGCGTQTI